MKRPLLTATIALLSLNAFCQAHDPTPLNIGFAGMVTFKVDKQDRLVMDFHEDGVRFRQDIVRMRDLDPAAIVYSAEEDAIALKCLPDHAQCISKEIFKLDVVRATSRVTLPRPKDDAEGTTTIQLLRTLITPPQDQADAETPRAVQRKNARKEP
jgi:hypothetical protein